MSDKTFKIDWHKAFIKAIELEFHEYRHLLEFVYEYQLYKDPLRIDVVIIKKKPDVVIKKNIGKIFKTHNIIEYKSEEDNLSIDAYYKALSYVYAYISSNSLKPTDVTLTFVLSHMPKKLFKLFKSLGGYEVVEYERGISHINGERFAIQIVDRRKLSIADNTLLKALTKKLNVNELSTTITTMHHLGEPYKNNIYLDAIFTANDKILKEMTDMLANAPQSVKDNIVEAVDAFAKAGILTNWLNSNNLEIRLEKDRKTARKMLARNLSIDDIVDVTDLTKEQVLELQAEM